MRRWYSLLPFTGHAVKREKSEQRWNYTIFCPVESLVFPINLVGNIAYRLLGELADYCGRLYNNSQRYLCLNPWNLWVLPYIAIETLQVWLRILDGEKSWIIWVHPTEKAMWWWKERSEWCALKMQKGPYVLECGQPLKAGKDREMDFPLSLQKEPALPMPWLQPSETDFRVWLPEL